MNDYAGPPSVDQPPTFLHLLPARAQVIARRLQRFVDSGWDINGLALINAEARRLASDSLQHGLRAPAESLLALAAELDDVLAEEYLPDAELGGQLLELAQALVKAVPAAPDSAPEVFVPTPLLDDGMGWMTDFQSDQAPAAADAATLFNDDDIWGDGAALFGSAPGATGANAEPAAPVEAPWPPPKPVASPVAVVAPPSVPAASPVSSIATDGARLMVPGDFRVYHLTGYGELSLKLDQRIEAQGLEIELLEDVEELNELLSALPADLVLIDACFSTQLESIGSTVRVARSRNSKQRLLLVAIAEADDIALRLSARRAGVDSLMVGPTDASDVIRRLQALVDPKLEESFRVLIVEDDRSQALFAEGILRNAGMDSLVVTDALDVMPALNQFKPDLILMDLNMPGANGIELTELIREHEAFAHTPIVFLSGEASEDLQFDAIESGGDDFLTKPIRPRHLISAVQTRVRRHRQQESRRGKRSTKDVVTGLVERSVVLEQLDDSLQKKLATGGLVFIEVDGLGPLRERIGLTALEILLSDVSRRLTDAIGEVPATRFGDGSYLLLDSTRDDAGLEAQAVQLRQSLMLASFEALGHPLRLRVSVGVCSFRHGFTDASAMINAVEKITREARTHVSGVRRYEPPRPTDALKEAALLTQVREAIDQDSLVLLYQPVVAVAGHDISQYQVLLRLRDAQGKLRSAAEIIPMAERTSLIVEIDRWVMMQAIALIKERKNENLALRLYVTQSPLTLGATGQAAWLQQEIRDNGISGSSLVVEMRLEDVIVHAATVRQFCELAVADGVQFCLSQFESGAAADALIDQLPLSFVKLAGKYTVVNLPAPMRDELKTLIGRAHRRGLQVIGHGVEDAQAAATLWMSGIDYIQGNLVQQADQDLNFDFDQAVL